MLTLLLLVAMGAEVDDLLAKAKAEAVPKLEADIAEAKAAFKQAVVSRRGPQAKALRARIVQAEKEIRDIKAGKPWCPVLDPFHLKTGQIGRLRTVDENRVQMDYYAEAALSDSEVLIEVSYTSSFVEGNRVMQEGKKATAFIARWPGAKEAVTGKTVDLSGVWVVVEPSRRGASRWPVAKMVGR